MRRVLLAVLLLVLTACVEQAPAPAVSYGLSSGAASAGMHTVVGHETLWDIAQRYRLSMQDIIRINGMRPPYILTPNERIKLPAPREYKAQTGDTLYSISRLFDASPSELARMNALHAPYAITAGQTLRLPPPPLPRATPLQPVPEPPYSAAIANARPGAAYPLYGGRGDARPLHPQASTQAQPALNGENEAWQGNAGAQPLLRSDAIERQNLETPSGPVAAADEARTGTLPPQVEKALSGIEGQPVGKQATTPILASDTPPRAGRLFGWPVNGPVISGYGTKAGGLHNDGINIRAPRGAPVRSAENGVVVYANDQLKGYGNLVLVRHADRWMTAYAHMDSIAVRRGQVVRKGEVLGRVGSTGGVSTPQLHFELRHGTEALNPEAFLER